MPDDAPTLPSVENIDAEWILRHLAETGQRIRLNLTAKVPGAGGGVWITRQMDLEPGVVLDALVAREAAANG